LKIEITRLNNNDWPAGLPLQASLFSIITRQQWSLTKAGKIVTREIREWVLPANYDFVGHLPFT
jgi:hypothetical protein